MGAIFYGEIRAVSRPLGRNWVICLPNGVDYGLAVTGIADPLPFASDSTTYDRVVALP